MKKNILIIAAHPDDDILGCGGFMAKYNTKTNIRVIFIAEGSSCRYQDININVNKIQKTIETRNNYAKDALKVLGVKQVSFYNLPCGRLDSTPIIEINKIIENELNYFKPDMVVTHAEDDTNNDHRIVYRSTLMATRPGSFKNLKTLLSFEILSSSEWNFSKSFLPNHFESMSLKHLNLKWKALECFKSEIKKYPHPRSENGLKTLAQYRGMQSGFHYAEAFKIIRNFK
ncbi:PIG-L family deacetylase [Gammaproteobacteria bacterium]|nr:PIG-L family deacetylase [Gammaproteobacteria bacterium]